jgi:hypothetical protein
MPRHQTQTVEQSGNALDAVAACKGQLAAGSRRCYFEAGLLVMYGMLVIAFIAAGQCSLAAGSGALVGIVRSNVLGVIRRHGHHRSTALLHHQSEQRASLWWISQASALTQRLQAVQH